MALKHEGCSVSLWDGWSRNDSRYHSGECEKKWETFNGSSVPVTGATVFQMARQNGYKPSHGYELDWDSEIYYDAETLSNEPTEDVLQLIKYLETLFESSDNVGYVTESWKKDDRFLPSKGHCDRTAGQLIEALSKCGGDIGSVMGDYNPEAGAWIRFNPLDGKGVKNDNVTEYRYTLVECDNMELSEQRRIIEKLRLPVACLVYSGKKSIHAIVHVGAGDNIEYRKRVEYIYQVCNKAGLSVDIQNKNPSRLSRMPGVLRNGKVQELLATNIGCRSFDEWKEYIETENDDLPEAENAADFWENIPPLNPCLIDNVLRQGHKMLIAGPSKAGKSFALIELAIAIAEGKTWMDFKCAQGKVWYINLELDDISCKHRIKDVYKAMNIPPDNLSNLDIWNLRGRSQPMDKLAPKLIRRAREKKYIAIIIDPIYKVITGDENSADQMAAFCNQFDKICTELNTAVIYCHHHSKGSQAGKKTMDRASGSGVFARDPDALIDMSELPLNDRIIQLREEELRTYTEQPERSLVEREADGSEESICVQKSAPAARRRTAWQMDGTLREFAKFKPLNLWFEYPVHSVDTSGILNDVAEEESLPSFKKAALRRKQNNEDRNEKNRIKFENAVNFCNDGEPPTLKQLEEYLGIPNKTLYGWIKRFGYMIDKNSRTVVKCDENIDSHDRKKHGGEKSEQ